LPEAAAARFDDPVAHSHALGGFIAGALIGVAAAIGVAMVVGAVATAVAAEVVTGGLATPLVAGIAVTLGELAVNLVAGGWLTQKAEQLGESLGSQGFGSPSGKIAQGSATVIINDKPAARVTDKTSCDNSPVAQGSDCVFINGQPAARLHDKLNCGGAIIEASPNVFIGGGSVTVGSVASEVPSWVRWAAIILPIIPAIGGLARALGPALAEVEAQGFSRALQSGAKAVGRAMEERAGGVRGAAEPEEPTITPATPEPNKPSMSMSDAVGDDKAAQLTAAGKAKAADSGFDTSNLSDDEIGAIHGYTTNEGYEQLNPALRGQEPMTPETQAYADHVSSGLDKLDPYVGQTYRGTDLPESVAAQYVPGNVVSDPAFVSTDTNAGFGGKQYQMTIDGTNGRDIAGLSKYSQTESEVLFKPGTQFEVLDRTTDPVSGVTQIHMREVGGN
jgi:uncharacterized Zn-binding protein involved in type VI secretion